MDFEVLRVDAQPVDAELLDSGTVGPELAYLAEVYRRSPRALVWHAPSPEWRMFALLPPLASRLSLMTNPIFAQLTRSWGLNVRFIGIDRDGLAYDFRSLLSDHTLRLLVELLGAGVSDDPALLDTLFAALAQEMLTILQRRGPGWGRHLDVEHRLEPLQPASLFARDTRYPDFLARLRAALRDELIDIEFYGRALRSMDLREGLVEEKISNLVESQLDPETIGLLRRTQVGLHLGCYNWLQLDRRHAASRAHVLGRLAGFAGFFAEALVPMQASLMESADDDQEEPETWADDRVGRTEQPPHTLDLRRIAARNDSIHSQHWAAVLQRAIDAGQDRAVIEAIAQRFAVHDNVIRQLWREPHVHLGAPPTWQLTQILRRLAECDARNWPVDEAGWRRLIESAFPAESP